MGVIRFFVTNLEEDEIDDEWNSYEYDSSIDWSDWDDEFDSDEEREDNYDI